MICSICFHALSLLVSLILLCCGVWRAKQRQVREACHCSGPRGLLSQFGLIFLPGFDHLLYCWVEPASPYLLVETTRIVSLFFTNLGGGLLFGFSFACSCQAIKGSGKVRLASCFSGWAGKVPCCSWPWCLTSFAIHGARKCQKMRWC